jgi:hypothetical protein
VFPDKTKFLLAQVGACGTLVAAASQGHQDCVKGLLPKLDTYADSPQRDLRAALMTAGMSGHTDVFHLLLKAPTQCLSKALQDPGLLEALAEATEGATGSGENYVACIRDAIRAKVDLKAESAKNLWPRLELVLRARTTMEEELHIMMLASVSKYPCAEQAKLDYLARLCGVPAGGLGQASRHGRGLFTSVADYLESFQICWPSTMSWTPEIS